MSERPFEIRADLRDLPPYRAPQIESGVRLNTNESPYPPPDAFFEDLATSVRALQLNRYPDREATALRKALGERNDWPPEGVYAAHGSNEILQTLFLTFGGPERSVVTFEPTYSMYAQFARVTATTHVRREVPEPWTLDAETVAWGISFEPPAITLLCSPNNPTGNSYPLAAVKAALDGGPGIVVVDEAYIDFGGTSARALLADEPRLVIVRSMSKSWRLAGARLGYLLAHPWLVEAIQVARLPYHLSTMAQLVGEVALRHDAAMLRAVEEVVGERERLHKELSRVPGVEVFPSDANFILFRTPRDGETVWARMAEEGVLVRNFSAIIPRALRVTVSTADENASFVEALRSVLADAR